MRFMMIGKGYETGAPPDPKFMAAIGQLTEEMVKKGVVLETGGLLPTAMGARIRAASGKLTVTDGPFSETKEVLGGYAILKASSKAEAIELGRAFMKLSTDFLGPSYEGELEIRQMVDPADCCPDAAK